MNGSAKSRSAVPLPSSASDGASSLASMICLKGLQRCPSRPADQAKQSRALVAPASALAEPRTIPGISAARDLAAFAAIETRDVVVNRHKKLFLCATQPSPEPVVVEVRDWRRLWDAFGDEPVDHTLFPSSGPNVLR